MTYSEMASQSANLSFLIWGSIFLVNYLFFFIKYRNEKLKALAYSGLSILSFFTLLNIYSAPVALFGGPADNIGATMSAGLVIYVVHALFLLVLVNLFFTKTKISKLLVAPIFLVILFMLDFYIKLFIPLGLFWLAYCVAVFIFSYRLSKSSKCKKMLTKFAKRKEILFFLSLSVFVWSLIWVGGFLYRNREVVFDCSIHSHRDEFVELGKNEIISPGKFEYKITQKAKQEKEVLGIVGNSSNVIENYFNMRYSDVDTTYFYCPKPFISLQNKKCLGYRVTVGSDDLIKNMQKRGLWCSKTNLPLELNPINDKVYYYYWSSDMWSFYLIPSEHYVMERKRFSNIFRWVRDRFY